MIFLFMAGFMIALAIQRWGLHRRVALNIVRLTGTRPAYVIAGFMLATAFISMWVSNTATAVMMLPVALPVIAIVTGKQNHELAGREETNFAVCLMLGIAYAASVGGMATLIGTPPNALLAGFMAETYGVEIGFARWMLVWLPLVIVLLPLTWVILTRIAYPIHLRHFPNGQLCISDQAAQLGKLSRGEKLVGAVFLLTAALWITQPWLSNWIPGLSLSDAGIAIFGAEHNTTAKREGGVRIVSCLLPVKSPWLNPIEPCWMHGKRAIVEPERKLTAGETKEWVCRHFGCPQLQPLTLAKEVA